jgi:alpha-methylacyl-CoA racemase
MSFQSTLYLSLRPRSKSHLLCDIRTASVQTLMLTKVIPKVDVLLDPYRPGVMEKLGLGPEVVLKVNPRIIYARLTGYGQQGKE